MQWCFREATSDDFGYYGCTVTNSRGSDELSIRLEPQEVFPTLVSGRFNSMSLIHMISPHQVVMVGVFLAIILMLLATLLFLLCRRKLCPPCPCPQTPDKPVKQNNHEVATEKVFTFSLFKISLSTVCWKGGRQDVGVRRGWLGGGRGQHWPLFPQVLTRVWVLKIPPPILPPSQALPLCSRVPAEAGPDQFGLRAIRLLCAGLSSGAGPTPLSSIR